MASLAVRNRCRLSKIIWSSVGSNVLFNCARASNKKFCFASCSSRSLGELPCLKVILRAKGSRFHTKKKKRDDFLKNFDHATSTSPKFSTRHVGVADWPRHPRHPRHLITGVPRHLISLNYCIVVAVHWEHAVIKSVSSDLSSANIVMSVWL